MEDDLKNFKWKITSKTSKWKTTIIISKWKMTFKFQNGRQCAFKSERPTLNWVQIIYFVWQSDSVKVAIESVLTYEYSVSV